MAAVLNLGRFQVLRVNGAGSEVEFEAMLAVCWLEFVAICDQRLGAEVFDSGANRGLDAKGGRDSNGATEQR